MRRWGEGEEGEEGGRRGGWGGMVSVHDLEDRGSEDFLCGGDPCVKSVICRMEAVGCTIWVILICFSVCEVIQLCDF